MPTRRAFVFLFLALGLYLLANQTQVGWVYIMANGLIGPLLLLFFYSRGMLSAIEGERSFRSLKEGEPSAGDPLENDPLLASTDFFEDDPVEVTLTFRQARLKPAFMVAGEETCPFTPPPDRVQPLFIPAIFKGQPANLTYQTSCDRRGLYTFPPLKLHSGGPFNFFRSRHTLPLPAEILVYPSYYPLKRLRLLESRGFTERQLAQAGAGSEVIGTREYRPGDSLRQVHWRSTARLGKLVVKEFADQEELTMTVVLDLSRQGNLGSGKFSTFETAVRLAASLGYYATEQRLPFYLAGQSERWQPPAIALDWWGILNYLARVQQDGQVPLAAALRQLPPVPLAVVLVSRYDEAVGRELARLPQRGTQVLALIIGPDEDTPLPSSLQPVPGLEISPVTPQRWAEILAEL